MRTSHKIIALAVGLGLFIWFADGLTDYIWFYKGSLLGLLLTEVPAHELYIRLLILVCFVGFGVVAGGIVERLQKARTQLSASRQWLSTTLTSIGDAVIVTDRQGRVSFLNPTAEGLTGWRASEARGRPLHEVFNIINEYTLRPVASPVDKVLAEGIVVGLANHTLLVSKDGRRAPIEDSGAPIKTAEGKVDGVVLVFRDVSGRRKAEEERARLDDQLKQSQKLESLGTLAGGLAHEFNNILTVMMGYGEAALGQARNGVVDIADLEQVLAAGRKGHSLVSGIMTYSRRQEARVGPGPEPDGTRRRGVAGSRLAQSGDRAVGSGSRSGENAGRCGATGACAYKPGHQRPRRHAPRRPLDGEHLRSRLDGRLRGGPGPAFLRPLPAP